MEAKQSFSLTWCEKHKNWWVTNCPDCMVDANEQSIKREGMREVWEWMNKYRSESTREFVCLTFLKETLEAKLKELGL